MPARLTVRTVLIWSALLASTACFDQSRYLPTSPDFQGAIAVTADRMTVPADGFSTSRVTAALPESTAAGHRVVTFETTAGTFAGSGSPEVKTVDRTVDVGGSVTVELRSSRSVESATVTAKVKDVPAIARTIVIGFTGVSSQDIIRVSAQGFAPADGATVIAVTAEVAAALPGDRRRVTFATSLGTFTTDPNASGTGRSITVDADGSNRAVAYLQSPKDRSGTAFITATVDSTPAVSASTQVDFRPALPEQILVTTDKATAQPLFTETVKVTVDLIRAVGVPTQGTIVTFRAVDALGVERGAFTNVLRSNADGVASADFTPGPTAAAGPLTITASVNGVSGRTTIEIVP